MTAIEVTGSTTGDDELYDGVYLWGSLNESVPDSLTHAYSISSGGTTGKTVKVGMVAGFGSDLYIGWEDESTFGIDIVSKDSSPAGGLWESLIFDNGNPAKSKLAHDLTITFESLISGHSVTPREVMSPGMCKSGR